MLSSRSIILFILALALGIGAAIFANTWIQKQLAPTDVTDTNKVSVVVASLEIPFGQQIGKEHVKTVVMDKNTLPDNAFSQIEEVEGKISNTKIFKGEIILGKRLVDAGEGSTLAALITPKMRAVTVRVNDVIGVAGFLLPGNRVDVLSSVKVNKKAQTKILIEDCKVLAVDQTASQDKDKPIVVRAVTLELEPKQAEELVKATTEGNVQLALRNPIDDSKSVAEKKSYSTTVKKRVVASKPRQVSRSVPTTTNVTVIRGTQVERTKVKL